MKKLTQYITEFININNIKTYKYTPKNRKELIECIKAELEHGNTDLNCIDTSKINDMWKLFSQRGEDGIILSEEQQKTLDISKWNVSEVENMVRMFHCCTFFNCDISNWDVSKLEDAGKMFYKCESFKQNLNNWRPNVSSKYYNIFDMFKYSGLEGKEPSWYEK